MNESSHESQSSKPTDVRAIRRTPRGQAPRQAAEAPQGAGLADTLQMLRQWWWQCTLAGVALAGGAAAIVWLTFTPVYEAQAFVEIMSNPPYIAFPDETQSRTFAQTQLETIKSPIVLSPVAALPTINSLPQARAEKSVEVWLAKYLNAEYVNRSELCRMSFKTSAPQVAADVANAVMDQYLRLHENQSRAQTDKLIGLLDAEQKLRHEQVKELREKVRTLTRAITGRDPIIASKKDPSVVIQNNPFLSAEEQLIAAEVKEAVMKAERKALQNLLNTHEEVVVQDEDLVTAVRAHPEVEKLRKELETIQMEINSLKQASAPHRFDAAAESKLKQLEATQESLEERMEELSPEVRKKLEAIVLLRRKQALESSDLELQRTAFLKQEWKERRDQALDEMADYGEEVLNLEFARADLQRAEEVYARIAERIIALTTEQKSPQRAVKAQAATPPTEPLEIVPVKIMSMACLVSFCFPFGLAFLWERRVRRISDSRRVTDEAKLPVLAEIASLPNRLVLADRASDGFTRDRITFEESIDGLRVALMLSPNYRDVQTLVITSAASREGKTSLASSLAISLAQACREPILLIDADMRAPNLHDMFGAAEAPGLAEVLGRECERDAAVVREVAPHVDLLPAGHLGASPHVLLRQGAFNALLADAKSKYRYVVIDCPPVLTASEALVIANAADGTLLCTRCDFSRAHHVRSASERLTASGARLLGAVVSAVPTRVWAQRSGGYGYGWERMAVLVSEPSSEEA